MGDCLGAERVTCPLLVTTVKLGLEQQQIMEAGHKTRSRLGMLTGHGPVLWGELRSRRQVSRQSLCGLRRGGQKPDNQSELTSAPEAPEPSRPSLGACACEPWARATSQGSVSKARADSWEQACTSLSKHTLENTTLERELAGFFNPRNGARIYVIF